MTKAKRQAIAEINRLRLLFIKRRRALRVSLRELERVSGVSVSTINRFENGKEINLTHYAALVAGLTELEGKEIRTL